MSTEQDPGSSDPTVPDDAPVDPGDAGLPTDPDLDDDNVVVTPPDDDGVPGSAAG